jgi:hypothetical protein
MLPHTLESVHQQNRRQQIQIVIRNSQLLLGLILPLLLIAVGLIDIGKRTGLTTM